MKVFSSLVGIALGLAMLGSQASADIILTFGSASFAANSGVQSIDLFARSTSADSTTFLVADYDLSGGSFPATAGVFNQPGFVGFGNFSVSSSSILSVSPFTTANLAFDFTATQLFPAINTLAARLLIDTTGLTANTYTILASNVASDAAVTTSGNGSFTITAVPEPTSMLTAALGFGVLMYRRRRSSKVLAA